MRSAATGDVTAAHDGNGDEDENRRLVSADAFSHDVPLNVRGPTGKRFARISIRIKEIQGERSRLSAVVIC
jgi:hypothetical protein